MRRIAFLFAFISSFSLLQAQSISRQLVATAGGVATGSTGSISFSIGEPVIGTVTGGGFTLTQGFQQPESAQCTITGFDPFPASIYSRLDSLALKCSSLAASADRMPVFSSSTLVMMVRLSRTDSSLPSSRVF